MRLAKSSNAENVIETEGEEAVSKLKVFADWLQVFKSQMLAHTFETT